MINLEALSKRVKKITGSNLLSIIVFGSYARGDYNKDSDIDLIVVLKNKRPDLIAKLDELNDEVSLKTTNWVDKKASRFLNMIGFKRSIFVFDEKEFYNKKFNFCDSKLLSWLLIPKGIIWSAIKREAKIVYGKDLLDFNPRISLWDKIKAPLPGIGACFIAGLMLPFSKDKALMLAQTGLRWTYMNVKGVLHRSEIMSVFGNLVEIIKISFKANYA